MGDLNELPLWAKRIGPWIFVIIPVVSSWFVLSVSPPETFRAPAFVTGLAGFAILARLWLPLRQSIKGRQKARPALIGTGTLAASFIIVGMLATVYRDLFLPLASGAFVGFFFTNAVLLAYYVTWKSRLLPCARCDKLRAFLRDGKDWYCPTCGKRWSSPDSRQRSMEDANPASSKPL